MSDGHKRVAAAVRAHIAREHISREEFAFRTRLGKSTIDKFMTGLFSERTLAIVEDRTGLSLRPLMGDPATPAMHEADPPARALGAAPTRPSIAVLPFANLSGDPAQDFFADGITEDIATALARLRWLFVIARGSTFVFRGRGADLREAAGQLGVRYVLEGSVRAADGRLRVTGHLVDAETGKSIWAERYDRELRDIFALQDDITARVVAAVEPHVYSEESMRATLLQPESIDAWGLVMRAIDLVHRVERARNEEARALLHRAIALEPGYARAHALLGWATSWAAHCDWLPDRAAGRREADRHARAALALDPGDPWARMVAGFSLSTAGQHDRAIADLAAALAINPSFALGHSMHGWALLRAGRFTDAQKETAEALRLSPLDTFSGLYTSVHGLALLAARRFAEALPYLRTSVAAFPDYGGHYNTLISCCGHLGLMEEAHEFMSARGRIEPPLRLSTIRESLRHFAHRDVFVDGLARAGVPE